MEYARHKAYQNHKAPFKIQCHHDDVHNSNFLRQEKADGDEFKGGERMEYSWSCGPSFLGPSLVYPSTLLDDTYELRMIKGRVWWQNCHFCDLRDHMCIRHATFDSFSLIHAELGQCQESLIFSHDGFGLLQALGSCETGQHCVLHHGSLFNRPALKGSFPKLHPISTCCCLTAGLRPSGTPFVCSVNTVIDQFKTCACLPDHSQFRR